MNPRQSTHLALGVLCLSAALLAGCGVQPHGDGGKEPLRVTVGKPVVRAVASYDYFTGNTKAVDFVEVRARVSGYLEKLLVREGAPVNVGDKLFEVDPRP